MGKLAKAALFMFALFAAALGAWIIAVPIFALIFVPPLLKGKKGTSSEGRGTKIWLDALGVTLVLLGVIAASVGGTFSPIVFIAGGAALILRRRLKIGFSSQTIPVENSILLRSRWNPFLWVGVAEAKVATRDIEGALSGVSERVLLLGGPPRILLVFLTNSWRREGAEKEIIGRIRSEARALVPLGVYLLPLDSAEAVSVTKAHTEQVRIRKEGLQKMISVTDFGAAAYEGKHGFLSSFELYARPEGTKKETTLLSGIKDVPRERITVRDFIRDALQKVGAPHPDSYSAFLGGMAATEGETLGQRMTQTENRGQVLLVASAGGPPVGLTKAQLRAIAEIYE